MQKRPIGHVPYPSVLTPAASGHSPLIKMLLIMKIVIFLLFTGVIGVQASVRSQSVTFSGQDVSLKKVFAVIKKQTGYTVFYNRDMLLHLEPLSITANKMPLKEFLGLALEKQPLNFRIEGTNIILSDKEKTNPPAKIMREDPVLIPPVSVSGTITGTEGEPLVAVSIRIKGSSAGTATNISGNFSLANVPENAVLEISSVGYETVEIRVRATQNGYSAAIVKEVPGSTLSVEPGNQLVLRIMLPKSISDLDETVVIAYGSVKKRDLTGSVVSIKEKDIMATPVNNVMEALQGRVAGMDINRSSGAIGNNVDILLRGNRSIYGDNSPLFIVDGVQSEYTQINPSDIASIDILKDASSTAIYGSAGSNGVVIITTKRGKENKSSVNFDAFYGFSGDIHFLHGMVGDEFINYRREHYRTVNGEYPQDVSQIFTNPEYLDAYNKNKWIDWVGEIQNKAATEQKYNLSFSGGTEKTKVYTSFTYTREQGMLNNENQTRYGVRLNLDHDVARWMKLGTNLNINYTIRNGRGKNIFTNALKAFPLGDPYDEFGNINQVFIEGENSPLAGEIPNQWADQTNTTYATANTFMEINPFRGLSLRSTLGVTLHNARQGRYFGPSSIDGTVTGFSTPLAAIYNTYGYNYIWENILSYTREFNDHNVTVTGITSWAKNQTDNNNAYAQGQELDYYLFYNLAAGTAKIGNVSSYTQKQRLSFAGRLNYSYRGKYLLTLTNRWDGVSHLAEGHKWAAFPAAAVAWRVSDETFMDNTRGWLNEMKFRVGYGVTGNSGGMSAYSSQTQAASYQAVSLDGKLVAHTQNAGTYSNPSISWERSYNLNIGLDMVLLKNRIDLAFDVYNTDTKDLLFRRALPVTSAVTAWGSALSTWQNIGETNNKGWEVTLRTVNIRKADLDWSSSFSFTRNREKIVSLPDGDLISSRLFMGHPINVFYDYKKNGIWSTHEEAEAALYGAKPGYVRVETIEKTDANGVSDNGVHPYTSTDQMILGTSNPSWLLGVNNTVRYKNFDLSVFTMVRWGQMIESKLLGWYTTKDEGQPRGVDYWTPENQSAYYPRPGIVSTTGMSSLRYMDGSFVKVKNITVGFSLPDNWRKPVFMNRGRIYATAYNPIVITRESKLKGTDPETGGSDVFPLYSTYVIGMNLNF